MALKKFLVDVVLPDSSVAASKFIKNGGLSTQFLMADGSTSLGGTNLTYTASSINGTVLSDTGTDAIIPPVDFVNAGLLTPTEKKLLYNSSSTGVTVFGGLSVNTDTTKYDVGIVEGWFVDNHTNPNIPTVVFKSFAATTANSVLNIGIQNVTYIAIDVNGTLQQSPVPFSAESNRDYISLGVIIHSNRTTINAVNNQPDVAIDPSLQLSDLIAGLGFFNVRGNIFSPNGANLSINKNAGYIFKQGSNFVTNNKNPHTLSLPALVAPSNIRYRTQLGAESLNTSVISPNFWDNAGVIEAMVGNRWSIQRIFVFQTNLIRIQYGQATYISLADAIQAITTENFITEQNILENGLFRALLVVRNGTTDLTDTTKALFIEANRFGSVSGLGNMSTSSLQQAYNNSVTPKITTNSDLGSVSIRRGSALDTDSVFEIQNGAGIATAIVNGNGNITGASFIKSGGLSSQFLKADGSVDSSTYALTSTPFTTGRVPYTTGTSSLGDSSKLLWDNTNSYLQINGDFPRLEVKNNINNYSVYFTTSIGGSLILKNHQNKTLALFSNTNASFERPKMAIGDVSSIPGESQLYVYGGASGANIDARGSVDVDEANIDLEGNDWTTNPSSLGFSYFGRLSTAFGTVLGYARNDMAQIRFFNNATALITSSNTTPIRFGINDVEIGNINDKGFSYQSNFSSVNSSNPRWLTDKEYVDTKAPISGSANYIQNQSSSAQSANMWISGQGSFGATTTQGRLNVKDTGSTFEVNTNNFNVSLLSFDRTLSAYRDIMFRGRDFIFSPYDTEKVRINDSGAATFASSVTAPTFIGALNGNASSATNAFGLANTTGVALDGIGIKPNSAWDSRPGGNAALQIGYHTGVSLHGYPGYGGVRLYSAGHPDLTSSILRLEASDSVKTYGNFYNDSTIFGSYGSFASTVTAPTFIGALSGNASKLYGVVNGVGYDFNDANWDDGLDGVIGKIVGENTFGKFSAIAVRNFLGLGSNAYSSTAYLPLTGGTLSGSISALSIGINQTAGVGYGISLYGGAQGANRPSYGLMFATTANQGTFGNVVGDWATYFTMEGAANRGWIFKLGDSRVASISAGGAATFASSITSTASVMANAILGTHSASWGGSAFPTLYSSSPDMWVMHINPHISYVQTGINGFTGTTNGAGVRFASNVTASSFWDIGVGRNGQAEDTFSIGRANTTNLMFSTTGTAVFSSTVTATGFFNSSDKRLKDVISRDGDVAHFTWKDGRDTKKHIGYIAQEIQEVYPDAVEEDSKGMLSVNYIEVLVAKIQALENRLKKLENGI